MWFGSFRNEKKHSACSMVYDSLISGYKKRNKTHYFLCINLIIQSKTIGGSRGGGGGRGQGVRTPPPPPLKNRKNIGFPNNINPDPLKSQSYLASSQWWSLSARQRNAISMAFRWWPILSCILILSPFNKLKKNVVSVGPPLTKLSGSAHRNN